jgi:SAM-dependent methyltransferase
MSIPGLNDWLETPQGRYVLDWEQRRCDLVLSDVFGFNAVQLGLVQVDLLRSNRMPLRIHCDDGEAPGLQARAQPYHLPFASASVDLVVLPHVLEFSAYPHQVLREVERVLVPEGQVLITGFNPWSLWGLRRKLGCRPAFPWNGRYLGVARLKDWLTLLGFEVNGGRFGCYAPPLETEPKLQGCHWMELAGDRWWPIFGGVYMLQAVKRVHGMRLILPKWRDRLAQAKALAPSPAVPRTNRILSKHE